MITDPPGRARVGCSGWAYKDWRGTVYPPELKQREWFAHYASIFDTVELNTTFYRLPSVTAVEQWAEHAPTDFVYALKLGAFGSHRMKLSDAARWLPNHLDRARRLGAALGPTLGQLPPRWKRNVERLDEFLAAAPRISAGPSSSGSRRGCTTTPTRCCSATVRRCASTISSRAIRGCSRRAGPTCASTGRTPPRIATRAATGGAGSGEWPIR